MKSKFLRAMTLMLSVALLLGLMACANEPVPGSIPETSTETSIDTTTETNLDTIDESEPVEEDIRFDNVTYNGRPFRIYTSTNSVSGSDSSNYLIEGADKMSGSVASDAAIERNIAVEQLLGVKLEFTQANIPYPELSSHIRTLLSAGDDEFDLIINKLFPLVDLSIEGHFLNTLSPECEFDFSRSYWYEDYMSELRLIDDRQYFLAGDYFIDILRSANALMYNRDMYHDFFRADPDEVYTWVRNHEWTLEKLTEMTADLYLDANSNGEIDEGDRFGMAMGGYWGPVIPFVISSNPTFITREEDGTPVMALTGDQRASDLVEQLRALNQSFGFRGDLISAANTQQNFVNGLALVSDVVSFGGLENTFVRDMEDDVGVIPYPILYAGDEYVTCTGDYQSGSLFCEYGS